MKLNMTTARIALAACLMFGWLAVPAFAQELADILGKDTAFSAKAHQALTDQSGTELFAVDSNYAYLDGDVRTESDMGKMQSPLMSPDSAAARKQIGRYFATVSIRIHDKHLTYTLFPAVKAYCESPFQQATDQTGAEPAKVERTELGKETIDGHPCVKCKMVVTRTNGSLGTMLVWEATDLDHFPIRTQIGVGTKQVFTTTFHEVNRAKPDASLFEVPAGYTRYNNIQEIMTNRVGNTPAEIRRNLGVPPPGGNQ